MERITVFKTLNKYLDELDNNLKEVKYIDDVLLKNNLKKIKGIKERIEDSKIKIGFWSFFSAGKSTIINNLIDKDILPVGQKTTTSIATTICCGEKDELKIVLNDDFDFKDFLREKIREFNNSNEINRQDTILSKEQAENLLKCSCRNCSYFNESESFGIKEALENLKIGEGFGSRLLKTLQIRDTFNSLPREYHHLAKEIIKETQEKIDEIDLLIKIYTNNLKLDELKLINENNFKYSDKIKEIIITIKDWKFNKNIQILDLPGFGSLNESHMNSALDKLKNMNAFVFVESETLTEGKCKKEMLNLKNKFPDIFKNSYFIKNKMSYIENDTKQNFDQKMKAFDDLANKMSFDKSRIFKIDALKEENGKECKYYKEFIKFKNKLIDDSKELHKEFVLNALNTLNDIHSLIIKDINKKIQDIGLNNSKDTDYLKGVELKKEINKECEYFEERLKKSINKLENIVDIKSISASIEKELCLEEYIYDLMIENKKKIEDKLNSKKDVNYTNFNNFTKEIIEEINVNEIIRNRCEVVSNDNFSENFYSKMLEIFDNDLLKFIPDKEQDSLEKIINKNIIERLNGALDVILYDYSSEIDDVIAKSKTIHSLLGSRDIEHFKSIISANAKIFEELNIDVDVSLSIANNNIKNKYNLNSNRNNLDNLIKILSYEISLYIKVLSNDISKYIEAIVNNYVKDTIAKIKDTLELDNFKAEFQQNIEEEINCKIDEIIKNKKIRIDILNDNKVKINDLKKDILNNLK